MATINGLAWGWDPGGGGDTTPPYIAFVSPASGATVSGTVTITVIATDSGSGMNYVDFYIGTSYLGRDSTASSNQYSKSFNSLNYNDGGYTLKAYAFDNDLNVAGTQRNIYIDNFDTTAPTVSFVSPVAGATLDGLDGDLEETITVTATDTFSGMDYVDFYIDGPSIDLIYLDTDTTVASGNEYSINFDFSSYDDGDYTLKAYAYDVADNVAIKSRDIYIETTGKPLSTDPIRLAYPTSECPTWHNDAARNPHVGGDISTPHPIMYSIARRATGYGMRKLGLSGSTQTNIVKGLARFAKDWLTPIWEGDGNFKTDLDVADIFLKFYSWMDYGAPNSITISERIDCRDISAFVTGMAMAMGIKAKMLTCQYGSVKHVAALLDKGSDDWFLISVFNSYRDSDNTDSEIQEHLSGGTPGINQHVFHCIFYIDVWVNSNYHAAEVGWIAWVLTTPREYWITEMFDNFQAPEFYDGDERIDFIYFGTKWGISVSQDKLDTYEDAESVGVI